MGYEVKIIIGNASKDQDPEDGHYFSTIATFDLCKIDLKTSSYMKDHANSILMENGVIKKGIPIYLYEGDNKITEDSYGDRLYAIPPDVLLEELKEKRARDSYRRLPPAIALIESISEFWGEEFQVVLYGY